MEGNSSSVYQVNIVSRMAGEGGAEVLQVWGPGYEQGGAGGVRGGGRAGQLNLCVETINPLRG